MCAERPKDAVRSPWTEGAWIMTENRVPDGWEWRYAPDDEWDVRSLASPYPWIVEARPATEADR